jgi:large subunit ribosomal protein L23
MDPYLIINRPVFSESIYDLIVDENKLVFEVRRNANKYQIKRAVELMYNIRVTKINTMITPKGEKRAIVALAPEYPAVDLASELHLF